MRLPSHPTVCSLAAFGLVGALALAGCFGGGSEAKACKANCPIEVVPVCGADGKNYKSACYAECAGTTAKHEGECKTGNEPPIVEDFGDDDY